MILDPNTESALLIERIRSSMGEYAGPLVQDILALCHRHEALLTQTLAMERALHDAIKAGERMEVEVTYGELTDRDIELARW